MEARNHVQSCPIASDRVSHVNTERCFISRRCYALAVASGGVQHLRWWPGLRGCKQDLDETFRDTAMYFGWVYMHLQNFLCFYILLSTLLLFMQPACLPVSFFSSLDVCSISVCELLQYEAAGDIKIISRTNKCLMTINVACGLRAVDDHQSFASQVGEGGRGVGSVRAAHCLPLAKLGARREIASHEGSARPKHSMRVLDLLSCLCIRNPEFAKKRDEHIREVKMGVCFETR